MKNMDLLLIFVIATNYLIHLSIDYIFQTNNTVKYKKSYKIMLKEHIIPGFLANFLSILMLFQLLNWKQPINSIDVGHTIFIGCLMIWMFHAGLDIIKVKVIQPKLKIYLHLDWISYIVDQILHFLFIFKVSFFEYKLIKKNNTLLENNFNKHTIAIIIIICVIILVTRFTQFLIKKILSSHFNEKEKNKGILASGTTIGIIERLLILFSILNISLFTPIITSIIALKSVTRFEKINSDSKYAEYYLLGSLISILSALLFSLSGKNIISIILK